MGLCGEVDKTIIYYGVLPYVTLILKPQIYIVLVWSDRAYDELLALDICEETRPELNEPEAPKCYIDLMKTCWDSDLNRLNVDEIKNLLCCFVIHIQRTINEQGNYEIGKLERNLKNGKL
jgi:hypothetical protein